MIVVVGPVAVRGSGADAEPVGLAATTAMSASAAGAAVELIARVGDDPAGDDVLLALARASVGHVAVLRDPARATVLIATDGPDGDPDAEPAGDDEPLGASAPTLEAADVELAMRYLTAYRVVVVVHPPSEGVLAAAAEAAAWAGAHIVALLLAQDPPAAVLPPDALVLAVMPDGDEDLGGLIGRYAASVGRGIAPAEAFSALRDEVAAAT